MSSLPVAAVSGLGDGSLQDVPLTTVIENEADGWSDVSVWANATFGIRGMEANGLFSCCFVVCIKSSRPFLPTEKPDDKSIGVTIREKVITKIKVMEIMLWTTDKLYLLILRCNMSYIKVIVKNYINSTLFLVLYDNFCLWHWNLDFQVHFIIRTLNLLIFNCSVIPQNTLD